MTRRGDPSGCACGRLGLYLIGSGPPLIGRFSYRLPAPSARPQARFSRDGARDAIDSSSAALPAHTAAQRSAAPASQTSPPLPPPPFCHSAILRPVPAARADAASSPRNTRSPHPGQHLPPTPESQHLCGVLSQGEAASGGGPAHQPGSPVLSLRPRRTTHTAPLPPRLSASASLWQQAAIPPVPPPRPSVTSAHFPLTLSLPPYQARRDSKALLAHTRCTQAPTRTAALPAGCATLGIKPRAAGWQSSASTTTTGQRLDSPHCAQAAREAAAARRKEARPAWMRERGKSREASPASPPCARIA